MAQKMLPKAELHVHLEGTIPPAMAHTLAKRNKLLYPASIVSSDNEQYLSKNFHSFLNNYDTVAYLIKAPQDYYDITYDYLKARAQSGAIYIELMYSPDHAEKATGIPSDEHLAAIQAAIDDAYHQFNIVGRILLTAVRHLGPESVERVAQMAHHLKTPCVVGFGLGGDELKFPPELFIKAFDIAHDAGLSCTIHAGEWGNAASVMDAILKLPIKRIGHGIQSIHSPLAIELIKSRNISLEICPTSNVYLKVIKHLKAHPLPKFIDAGVRVSLNSDDPPFMRTTLEDEYEKVQAVFNYSDEQMLGLTRMAIEDSFADEATKMALLERLKASA